MSTDNYTNKLYEEFGIGSDAADFVDLVEKELKDRFEQIDKMAEYNQLRVIKAMQECEVSPECFAVSTGYGYNDYGRQTLEKVYAKVFHTQDALVRPQITCGTHALGIVLFGMLRPGDELYYPCGGPYDTLEEVIGIRDSVGSLSEYGVTCAITDLLPDGSFDYDDIPKKINERTKLIAIQRSKGYADRLSFSVDRIGQLIGFIRGIKPDAIIMVDNCYGEFAEYMEPTQVGADIMAGSLIKNPGGGLCETGGYICGRSEYVERCAAAMTVPGLGREVGASLGVMRSMYQGLFMAPVVTASAMKGAMLSAAVYERLGFKCLPSSDDERTDIIQAITLGSAEALNAFCEGIQSASAVEGYVTPEAWEMPGYDDKVIMAAGAFIQGSSIELSADGPVREPYNVYLQGGLTYPHARLGVLKSLSDLVKKNIVKL